MGVVQNIKDNIKEFSILHQLSGDKERYGKAAVILSKLMKSDPGLLILKIVK